MIEEVQSRGPDGAVRITNRKVFEVCLRPRGFRELPWDPKLGGRAVFLASDNQGGGRWRSSWPAETLRARSWRTQVSLGWPRPIPGAVHVIHRPMGEEVPQVMKVYREAGCPVIVDVDDEVHAVPRQNRHQPTQAIKEALEESVTAADGLTVPTQRLADVYGPLARKVWVVPNRAPAWVGEIPKERIDARIRVGWQGTLEVHRQDIDWLAPVAKSALKGATLSVVGDESVTETLRPESSESWPWQKDARRIYALMARADIGIVPLDTGVDRGFNTSKSWIKALEYVTLGIPVVVTDLPEQRRLLGGTGAGFLVGSPGEMAERVQQLIADAELRHHMGRAAKELGAAMAIENFEDWRAPLTVGTEALSGLYRRG